MMVSRDLPSVEGPVTPHGRWGEAHFRQTHTKGLSAQTGEGLQYRTHKVDCALHDR